MAELSHYVLPLAALCGAAFSLFGAVILWRKAHSITDILAAAFADLDPSER